MSIKLLGMSEGKGLAKVELASEKVLANQPIWFS